MSNIHVKWVLYRDAERPKIHPMLNWTNRCVPLQSTGLFHASAIPWFSDPNASHVHCGFAEWMHRRSPMSVKSVRSIRPMWPSHLVVIDQFPKIGSDYCVSTLRYDYVCVDLCIGPILVMIAMHRHLSRLWNGENKKAKFFLGGKLNRINENEFIKKEVKKSNKILN